MREALEATDWEGEDDFEGVDDFGDFDGFDHDDGFGEMEGDMGTELLGLREALREIGEDGEPHGGLDDESREGLLGHDGVHGDGIGEEEEEVEEMERLMQRVLAIKETGSAMEEDERKKFAKRAVSELMKEI